MNLSELAGLPYDVSELDGRPGVRLEPRIPPICTVIGLNGQFDTGRRFAAVFSEILAERPVRLICPDVVADQPDDLAPEPMAELLGLAATGPVWIVGLSAGAILGLRMRPHVAGRVTGVVAIAGSHELGGGHHAGVPTLYIHGTDDRIFPIDRVAEGVASEPSSRLHRVEGWGHGFPYRLIRHLAWPWMAETADATG